MICRRRKKYKVNCWFCNQNAYVGYEQRFFLSFYEILFLIFFKEGLHLPSL